MVSDKFVQGWEVLRGVVLLAVAPPLVYCAGLLFFLEGVLPWPGPWLIVVALTGAAVGVAANSRVTHGTAFAPAEFAELVVRYALALMLIQFALNKLIPGQFLLYNRDFDLTVRELPPRRLAWHFLGYSRLYNGFVASIELAAGLFLCSRRTVRAGGLLSLAALVNVVVVDTAFGIRGALPIATVMACAALALLVVHLDLQTLRSLVWRRNQDVRSAHHSLHGRILWLVTLTLVLGFPLYRNLGARRGLGGQVPPAGRWEVAECRPPSGLAMCETPRGRAPAVLYIEVGQWGQLVVDSERRNASFSYDKHRRLLEVRIVSSSSGEPEVVLTGTVEERDATVVLDGRAAGVEPFEVRLRRTHWAPWPPVRAF